MNKVTRFEIIKPIGMTWNVFNHIFYEVQHETQVAENTAMNEAVAWGRYSYKYKKEHGTYPDLKKEKGYKIIDGYIYNILKDKLIYSNTANLTTSIRTAVGKYKSNTKDITCGNISTPSFKNTLPIDIHNQCITLLHDDGDYIAVISLLSNKGKKEINLSKGQVAVKLLVKDNSQKQIIGRCLSKEYGVSASQLIKHKNKIFLNLCYSFEPKKNNTLDENRIMGIDLGIVNPAYVAFNFSDNIRYHIGDDRIIKRKIMLDKELSIAKHNRSYRCQGSVGHGRKLMDKVYDRYSNKSHNITETINQAWSKYLIEIAVKNCCKIIQMENLSGFNSKDKFLKMWTYYDLQQKIIYKAKEVGIEVVLVNPYKTSQRCSKCGYIDPDNRPERGQFICKHCGYHANADYNAAKNISMKGIDKIIADTLKAQGNN